MSPALVRTAFREQANACRLLGSPFTAALCDLLAEALQPDQGAVAARVLGWRGDPSGRADSVPLRLCGALHALVLTGADPALAQIYSARRPDAAIVLGALSRHRDTVLDWLDSPPQTNEVARSAAIIAAARFVTGQAPLPLRALELGASAGLNLNFSRYLLAPQGVPTPEIAPPVVLLTPDWSGPLPDADVVVAEAEGVDMRPVDALADGLRLMAYCWADQDARLARLRAALELARRWPPQVATGDAAAWIAAQLAAPCPGRLTLVFHTIAAQYFPPATQAACEAALQQAGARATPQAPVAHFAMEADGGDGAGLRLRLWDGAARGWDLGRADFHGRWLRWNPVPI